MADIATLGLKVKAEGIDTANRSLDDLTRKAGSAEGATRILRSTFLGLAAPIAAAAGAIFGLQRSISTLAGFERSMGQVRAITGATEQEMKALRDTAKELGATTEFSSAQAADALKFLGMAGFDAAKSIEAMPAVLDLATLSGMGIAEAADVTSNIMSGFGLAASEAASAADILAVASNSANTSVDQLGAAMKFAAPVAASLGISMGDTAAAIGVVSDAGIQGSQAGTGLRAVLASLVKPAKEGERALAAMGLTMQDVNPNTKSLAEIFTLLQERGLNAQAAMMLFGREAASVGLSLAASSEKLGDLSDRLEDAGGAAGKMAGIIRDDLQGDLDNLSSAAESVIIGLGDAGLTGVFRSSIQATTGVISVIASLTEYIDVMTYSAGALGLVLYRSYIPAVVAAVFNTGLWTSALVALRTALIATGVGALAVAIGGAVAALLRAKEATGTWSGAISLLGDRVSLVLGAIKQAWGGLVLYMESTWYKALASIYGSTDTFMTGLMRLMGISSDAAASLSAKYTLMADTSSRYASDAFQEATNNIKESLSDFDSDDGFIGPMRPDKVKQDGDRVIATLGEISTASTKAAEKAAKAYSELVRSAQQRIDQMNQEASLVGMAGIAADTLRMKLDLLHQAQEKGLKLTPKQKAELNGLADAYGVAAQKVAELQLAEEARFEREQLFRSPIDARIASELRNAGLEIDSVAGQAWASYVKLTDQISTAKDGAKEFASGFINDLLNGKSAIESVANALKKLGDKLIDMALDEMINGLFKNLMGVFNMGGGGAIGALSGQFAASGGIGLFADGGVTNKPAIFGEAGPEAAVPLPDGRTIPVTINSPQGGGGTVNSGNVYNFTGTSEEFQQFKKFVQERDRQFDSRAQNAVTKGNKQNRFR